MELSLINLQMPLRHHINGIGIAAVVPASDWILSDPFAYA